MYSIYSTMHGGWYCGEAEGKPVWGRVEARKLYTKDERAAFGKLPDLAEWHTLQPNSKRKRR